MAKFRPQSDRVSPRPSGGARRKRRWRPWAFVALVGVVASIGGGVRALAQLPIPEARGQDATTVILDRRGVPIAQLHAEQHRLPLTLDEVSTVLVDAVVASEDRDFFRHAGVDPAAIGRAAWFDIRNEGELQGGSTITQQYVKNAFLEADRTLLRKLREAVLSIKIERELSKPDILERYLNVIYLGRGAYGVEAASQVWFGTSAADLGIAQAAYLAALIRAPELADISRPDQVEAAYRRRSSVLEAMFGEGYITDAERQRAESISIESYTLPRIDNRSTTMLVHDAGLEWFVDMVRRELIERYGPAEVFAGGLSVTTSIDLDAQRFAFAAIQGVVSIDGAPDAAAVVLDDQGHVRVLVGGSDFSVSQVNLATGRAGGGGGRQPGSVFKPIVLAAALEQGLTLETTYPSPALVVVPGADAGNDWEVTNADGRDRGQLDLIEGTVVSSNTVYAGLAGDLDLDAAAATAARLGIETPMLPLFSLVLGAQELAVLDMATGYSVFANDGELRAPIIVLGVTDDLGLDDHFVTERIQTLDPSISRSMTSVLQQVVERGTGLLAAIPEVPVAGKTGTSQDNRDAWFVGYSPRFTTAVWLGYADDGRAMVDVLGLERVTGGSIPARLWNEIMSELHSDLEAGSFPGQRAHLAESDENDDVGEE
ncbi:MAG: transglycosylase domain-containing protein [Acidimicrobiales bacterium]